MIPTRYVRSHSVGLVHPHANHDFIQQICVLKSIEIEFLMDLFEVSISFLIVEVVEKFLI